jgi:hypothetical protein
VSTLPFPITHVRWPSRDAAPKLERFVFGGVYAGNRPPRGIDPDYVAYWIRENVKPDSSPLSLLRVAHLLRFYERGDVLDFISRFLSRTDATDTGFDRNSYVLQCIGEVGSPEQLRFAGGLFSELLVSHPSAMPSFLLLLETAEVLAAVVDTSAIARLMQRELDAASKVPDLRGPEGLRWRKYSDYNRNQWPEALRIIEAKRRLLAADPAQRLQELVIIYMGESSVSSASMEIWAGRLIRDYARSGGQAAVVAAFARIFDATLRGQMPKPRKDFLMYRAGHAIIYMQGKLTFPEEEAFDAIKDGPECFLNDDLTQPSLTP